MKILLNMSFCCLLIATVPLAAWGQTKIKPLIDTTKKAIKPPPDTTEKKVVILPETPATVQPPAAPAAATLAGMLKNYSAPRVFNGSVRLTESTINGDLLKAPAYPTAMKGQGFDVTAIAKDKRLVLRMWKWTLKKDIDPALASLDKGAVSAALTAAKDKKAQEKIVDQIEIVSRRNALNFKTDAGNAFAPGSVKTEGDNTYYFIMSQDSVDQLSGVETPSPKWDATFGVLTTPFKIRYRKFAFSNNAGIGTAVFIQKKVNTNWSYGWVPGLSLTSVTLDAASTNIHASASPTSSIISLGTSTTRPAFTPSLSFMIAYKTINFTLGLGCDLIAKPTTVATAADPEAGWMYNGKPWIGLGFGVSLFGNNAGNATTTLSGKQTP